MSNKLILNIDASALKYSHCSLKFFRTVVQGYRGKGRVNDIEYGSAVHKYIDTYTKTYGDSFAAMAAAQDYWKTVSALPSFYIKEKKEYLDIMHLTKTCLQWMNAEGRRMFLPYGKGGSDIQILEVPDIDSATKQPILLPDGSVKVKPLAETKFRIPYFQNDLLEICLAGTIDFIGINRRTSCLVVRDYKSTSMWNAQDYFESYELSVQLMFYLFIIKKMAEMHPNSIIGHVVNTQPNIGCQIQGLFLKSSKDKDTEIINSKIFQFSDARMVEFEWLLSKAVWKIAEQYHIFKASGTVPNREGMLNDTCEMKFGKCPFYGTCKLDDESLRAGMLSQYFEQKPYDPLAFGTLPKPVIESTTT